MRGTVQAGGALSLRGSGTTATLQGCTFTDNSADVPGYGNDIYIDSAMSVTDLSVTDLWGDSGANDSPLDTYPSTPLYYSYPRFYPTPQPTLLPTAQPTLTLQPT